MRQFTVALVGLLSVSAMVLFLILAVILRSHISDTGWYLLLGGVVLAAIVFGCCVSLSERSDWERKRRALGWPEPSKAYPPRPAPPPPPPPPPRLDHGEAGREAIMEETRELIAKAFEARSEVFKNFPDTFDNAKAARYVRGMRLPHEGPKV